MTSDFSQSSRFLHTSHPQVQSLHAARHDGESKFLLPDKFCLKDSRSTQESSCCALGVVIYEMLNDTVPFAALKDLIVIRKATEDECLEIAEVGRGCGSHVTDDLWETLNWCWTTQLKSRPGVKAV